MERLGAHAPDDVAAEERLVCRPLDVALEEADVRRLGVRGSYSRRQERAVERELIDRLGTSTVERIVVRPFSVRRFDRTFGLVATQRWGVVRQRRTG